MTVVRHDLHIHSSYSDGCCSVSEIAKQAFQKRLDVIAITDHFWPSLGGIKGGTSVIESRRQEIQHMREHYPRMLILDGAELDVYSDGKAAPVAGGTDQFDIIICSLHFVCSSRTWVSVLSKLLEHNSFHVLGHWDGYLSSYDPKDGEKAAQLLADHNIAIELSLRYSTEHEEFLILARDAGCRFVLGSDSHGLSTIGMLEQQYALVKTLDLPLIDVPLE